MIGVPPQERWNEEKKRPTRPSGHSKGAVFNIYCIIMISTSRLEKIIKQCAYCGSKNYRKGMSTMQKPAETPQVAI